MTANFLLSFLAVVSAEATVDIPVASVYPIILRSTVIIECGER